MNISISVRDDISPDLAKKISALKNARPVLAAMGQTLVNLAKSAFDQPQLRPSAWPARKKDTGKPLLIRTTTLRRSLRTILVTNDSATVGTDRTYAAVHQFGSRKNKGRGSGIPPRPYWPLTGSPQAPRLTPKAMEAIDAAARRQIEMLLG